MLKALHHATSADTEISAEGISVLVHRAQAGDTEAFAELLRIFEKRLHRQALFLTGNEHHALDLLQETYIQTWNHLDRYDGRAAFFTWICSIMIHRHYDWLRRWRTRAFAFFDLPSEERADNAITPKELAEQMEDARVMRECLDELPLRQRTVVYLRFYAEESLEGIAALAHCSVGTVKSRLFHALRKLAKMQKIKQLRIDQEAG